MLKHLIAALLALAATAAFAAVDVNKASQADLESVTGIGPSMSGRIIEARTRGAFKDWDDFIARVGGVGPGNAGKFSANGLTVNGARYAATPKPTARSASKPAKAGRTADAAPAGASSGGRAARPAKGTADAPARAAQR